MIDRANEPILPMRCRGCAYDLHGLAEHRCPECGRGFDPTKPETYFTHPIDGRRWAVAACCVAFCLPVIAVLIGSDLLVEQAIALCWVLLAATLFIAARTLHVLLFRAVRVARWNSFIITLALSVILVIKLSLILWIAHL